MQVKSVIHKTFRDSLIFNTREMHLKNLPIPPKVKAESVFNAILSGTGN